mgnify:FL=1
MGKLWDNLTDLSQSNMYPFHMPGHKRNAIAGLDTDHLFSNDITEIDDFDNLHDPKDLLLDCQKLANVLYKASDTFYLVNGSTSGVMSSVFASTNEGDTILTARNCHKSLYHVAYLRNLNLKYVYPKTVSGFDFSGEISPKSIEKVLDNNASDIKAVFITSPTYEGIYSDIKAISDIVHAYGLPLIVDEAHGAHLGISKYMPSGAILQGADIVIHSLHKTLPAITQTALIHVNGDIVDRDRLKRCLRIFQTSSPSYLLMASIDDCISYMLDNGDRWAKAVLAYHDRILDASRNLEHIVIPDYTVVNDPCKIVLSCKDTPLTGTMLYDILRKKYSLQAEMACETYVLMIITGMDTQEGINRLIEAVKEIDASIESMSYRNNLNIAQHEREFNYTNSFNTDGFYASPCCRLSLRDAWDMDYEYVDLNYSTGRISGDFVNLYPPGIALVVPGEEIKDEFVNTIRTYLNKGLNVQGIKDQRLIRVVKWGK